MENLCISDVTFTELREKMCEELSAEDTEAYNDLINYGESVGLSVIQTLEYLLGVVDADKSDAISA